MTALNAAAKAALRDAGVSQAEWAREHFADGKWHGDSCGCSDDRCRGFHHDENGECGCLPVLLSTHVRDSARRARVSGPYETERDAMRDSWWKTQGWDAQLGSTDANHAQLADAVQGIAMGTWDWRILNWLAGYEPSNITVICGLIGRARAKGGAR